MLKFNKSRSGWVFFHGLIHRSYRFPNWTRTDPCCAKIRIFDRWLWERQRGRTKGCIGKGRSWPISRVLSWTTIPLGPASPQGSSSTPGCGSSRSIAPLFGLAPSGVYPALRRWPRRRWALTPPFHPYHAPCGRSAVCFLLHWPSACAAQALPGTLLCGARTFLGACATRLSGQLRR